MSYGTPVSHAYSLVSVPFGAVSTRRPSAARISTQSTAVNCWPSECRYARKRNSPSPFSYNWLRKLLMCRLTSSRLLVWNEYTSGPSGSTNIPLRPAPVEPAVRGSEIAGDLVAHVVFVLKVRL